MFDKFDGQITILDLEIGMKSVSCPLTHSQTHIAKP